MLNIELLNTNFEFQVDGACCWVNWWHQGPGNIEGKVYAKTHSVKVTWKGKTCFFTSGIPATKANSIIIIKMAIKNFTHEKV